MKSIQEIFKDPYSILYLLPYSESTVVNNKHQKLDDLYFIKSVISFSLIVLDTFLDAHLSKFDAQVGENLCQIRSYQMIYLAKKWLSCSSKKNNFSNYINQIKNYEKKLESVIFDWENAIQHAAHFNKSLDNAEKIHDFLARHDLFLELNEDIVFIIACYFLTHFNIRDDNIPIAINLDFISREFHISKYRSKRLTHKYQLVVCKLGCDFIIKLVKHLPNESDYTQILPHLYQVSDENRVVLPCLIVTEIILNHCLLNKIPILIIVYRKENHQKKQDVVYFLLTPNEKNTFFSLGVTEPHLHQYCLVIAGDMLVEHLDNHETPEEYAHRFLQLTPVKLILANTASHPQYSGKRLIELRYNPYLNILSDNNQIIKTKHEVNLNELKQFSLQYGCSKENQSTFLMKHVYASILSFEINKLLEIQDVYTYDAYTILANK